jgi:DNA-binding NtrC family response regulator
LIEDEAAVREALTVMLTMNGYSVIATSNGEQGLKAMERQSFDYLLTDLQLPGMNGIEVIESVKITSHSTVCIILTGHASVETAVEAMRAGAGSYLKKPFSKEDLLMALEQASEVNALQEENYQLKREITTTNCTAAILGSSPQIATVRRLIEKVADTDTTVLILGESGTGKELVARALHYGSIRADRPFVPINCGAIPENLLESELFGYEKGAFTGAIATKIGRFEAAHQGTVFLDEIGDMSPGLQVKILRVLQEQEFERLGGRKTVRIDVRVVAATNQNLELAVEEGRFREDLYYRLNVIPVTLPPLRDRGNDLHELINVFLTKISKRKRKKVKSISDDALRSCYGYGWPGNIRELENLIERIVVLKESGTSITPDDLPDKIKGTRSIESETVTPRLSVDGIDFNNAVSNFERELILEALTLANGVKKKAAEYLKLNRTTLIEKMKRMSMIDKPGAVG